VFAGLQRTGISETFRSLRLVRIGQKTARVTYNILWADSLDSRRTAVPDLQ